MYKNIENIYLERARRFFERLPEYYFADLKPLSVECWNSGGKIIPYAKRLVGEYMPVKCGDTWGKAWDSAWFHAHGVVPKKWRGRELVARFDFGGEGLLYDKDGVPYYSFSVSSIFDANFKREFYPVEAWNKDGDNLDFWIEASANQLFGLNMNESPSLDEPHPQGTINPVLKHAHFGVFRWDVWHLRLDFEVLLGVVATLQEGNRRRSRLIAVLNEAASRFKDNPENANDVREWLKGRLPKADADAMFVTAVGHAHIDTAWLWRVRETVRKCARTFANQLHNIKHYPDYVFGASAAQHYQFVKENYPELYSRIKEAVKAGRWEIQGGLWVECDCNLVSGESMVRQFLKGKNFFMDEFGENVRNVWIPDVFGYSASMPQICRLAGCDFLLTQKISWSQINRFPYNTFLWEGIDGSRLLTHFPPEDCYLSELNPAALVPAQDRFSENTISDEFVALFGIGDGGGGPKQEYIERGLRLADLAGSPKVRYGKAQDAFDRMAQLADKLPHWCGELYLELHRGTYTTQAEIKKGNRRLEQRLLAVERYLCGRSIVSDENKSQLDKAWKLLMLNQFHDILPGSSISAVYDDTKKDYEKIDAICDALLPSSFNEKGDVATLINTLPGAWRGIVRLAGWKSVEKNDCVVAQTMKDGVLEVLVELAGDKKAVLKRAEKAANVEKGAATLVLENDLVRYEFAENGELTSAYDKERGMPLLRDGQRGNVLSLYAERPNNYEAWDIDIYYKQGFLENAKALAAPKAFSNSAGLRIEFSLGVGNSKIVLEASLLSGEKTLRFHQEIDWNEVRRMLRVAFEADVNAREARCDIQYGYLRRVTNENTSWEQARFETPVHRYADLTDDRAGFALFNDCKYGMHLEPSCLDLTLLRATKYPDFNADAGHHSYSYAFYPHDAEAPIAEIIDNAAAFNRAPLCFAGDVDWRLPVSLDAENARLEVVKPAEKSDDLILRVVEIAGRHSSGVLKVAKGYKAFECDLLEWQKPSLALDALELHPFEIKTIRVISN